jgi:hypothetical protein
MSRKISLVAALLAAALVIPTTAAQADSGLTFSTTTVAYGDVPAGHLYSDIANPLTLTNNGGSSVTLESVTFTGGNWGWGGPGPVCNFWGHQVLAPGDSCQFWPLAGWSVSGDQLAQLGGDDSVMHVATDQGTTDVAVFANFVGAYAQLKESNWDPGVVGSTVATHTFNVKNLGNAPLTFDSITFDTSFSSHPATPSFAIQSDGCSGEGIAPGATCPVTLSYGGESDTEQLDFSTNAYQSPHGATGAFFVGLDGTQIAPFAVATHHISTNSFTLGHGGTRRHGVGYSFTSSHTPVNMLLQVINSHGRVVRSWTSNNYFFDHHPLHPSVNWRGHNNAGHFVKPGIYHFRVKLSLWGYHSVGGIEHVLVKRPA